MKMTKKGKVKKGGKHTQENIFPTIWESLTTGKWARCKQRVSVLGGYVTMNDWLILSNQNFCINTNL